MRGSIVNGGLCTASPKSYSYCSYYSNLLLEDERYNNCMNIKYFTDYYNRNNIEYMRLGLAISRPIIVNITIDTLSQLSTLIVCL